MMHHIRDLVQEAPQWAAGLVGILTIMFILSQVAISYTYGSVVATLAMVESPDTTAVIRTSPTSDEDPDATLPPYSDSVDDKKPLLVEQEVMLITPKPITSSLYGTVRHLRTRTGSRVSRFRGAGVALLYVFIAHVGNSIFESMAPRHPAFRMLGYVFVQVGLCRINMLWTHMVMSEPSSKSWFRRIAPRSSVRKIMLPTLAAALSHVATVVVPIVVYFAVDAEKYTRKNIHELTEGQRFALALKLFSVVASFVITAVFVMLPAQVALTRCQAALLSEEETPIVPFDRTFGGLVTAQSEGGSGKLRMKDAWRSFDWNSRIRLAKVWAKTLGLHIGSAVFYVAITACIGSSFLFLM